MPADPKPHPSLGTGGEAYMLHAIRTWKPEQLRETYAHRIPFLTILHKENPEISTFLKSLSN